MNDRRSARPRFAALGVVLAAGAVLAACTPPPEPTPDPITPWFAPGCYQSEWSGVPDIYFSGVADQVGNMQRYDSVDGTCTGETEGFTVVRSVDHGPAFQKCLDLGVAVDSAPNLQGYPAPVDAFLCLP